MDNLYPEKKFFSCGWDAGWLMAGVARQNHFLTEFAHKEVTKKDEVEAAKNTMFAAKCTEAKADPVLDMVLLAVSFYDAKPVLFSVDSCSHCRMDVEVAEGLVARSRCVLQPLLLPSRLPPPLLLHKLLQSAATAAPA